MSVDPKNSGRRNIVLIGMPGAGKSTVGVLLAKAASRGFLDTDVCMQVREGRTLQAILDAEGLREFCRREELCVLSLDVSSHVIATGGSVVYSEAAMDRLRSRGVVVLLELDIESLERRIDNLATRGLVIEKGQTLRDLYRERMSLYKRWADVTIDCAGKNQDQVVAEILTAMPG